MLHYLGLKLIETNTVCYVIPPIKTMSKILIESVQKIQETSICYFTSVTFHGKVIDRTPLICLFKMKLQCTMHSCALDLCGIFSAEHCALNCQFFRNLLKYKNCKVQVWIEIHYL